MNVTVAVDAAAPEDAVSVVFCAVPGVRVSVAGLAVTPAGRPVIATKTMPVKPLVGTAFTLTGWPVPPAIIVTVAGVAVNEKSGVGGGGGAERSPPPHDIVVRQSGRHAAKVKIQAALGAREGMACRETDSLICNRRPHGAKVSIGQSERQAGVRGRGLSQGETFEGKASAPRGG